jgi:hypothetical protein
MSEGQETLVDKIWVKIKNNKYLAIIIVIGGIIIAVNKFSDAFSPPLFTRLQNLLWPPPIPKPTYSFVSKYGDFRKNIEEKMEKDGYIKDDINPTITIKMVSEDPPGIPLYNPDDCNAHRCLYYYESTEIKITIGNVKHDTIGIGIFIPKTKPLQDSWPKVKELYWQTYKKYVMDNSKSIYYEIKKHIPK